MIVIKLSTRSKKKEVVCFLEELHALLRKDDFDIESDFIIIRKNKPNDEEHSTPYTLLDLDYDASDIIARLIELTIAEYSETMIDIKDLDPPQLYVFGKDIHGKTVYIMLKIKGDKRRIICVSFHYAKEKMIFPYA